MEFLYKHKTTFVIILSVLVILGISYVVVSSLSFGRPGRQVYGVTFDPEYAGYLGLDPQQVYHAILSDWHFQYLRLPVHWNKIEPVVGQFTFQEMDSLMQQANAAGAKVILAIGQKTPRWPECHLPVWARTLSASEYHSALANYLQAVVERYKNNPALEAWQVENEPFLAFGAGCPTFGADDLKSELTLVKMLDQAHPTMVTDSGELSTWLGTARAGDLFGTTLYRVVWNKYVGYVSYDWLPGAFYRAKLWFVGRAPQSAYVIELQAEPWITDQKVSDMPLYEQYKSMDLARLKKNIVYADNLGLPRSYLWGAEWWYWLKEKGIKEIPDFIATLNQ